MQEEMWIDRISNHLNDLTETTEFYNFGCPFCHEGNSIGKKKRAFILKNKEHKFYCHNCFTSYSFVSFLYNIDRSVYYQYKEDNRENKFYSNENPIKKEVEIVITENLEQLSKKFTDNLYPVKSLDYAYQYLVSRRVPDETIDKLLYYLSDEEKIVYNRSIVFPFYNKGFKTYYGFQSRQIINKFFHIELQNEDYPKIWNLFNIDNTKPVYIFEGFFDSIVIDNSVALNGADIPQKYMRYIQIPIFVFDNDKTGFLKAMKYAEKGYRVFVYPENFKYKDFNDYYCKEKVDRKVVSRMIKENTHNGEDAIMLIMDRQMR
jgi:hypothetical protein